MKQMNQQNSSSFDPYSWKNFYFHVDREEANRLLCEDHNSTLGSFLIRDSTSPGSYALSVREELTGDQQVRHYLIEPVESESGKINVKIAEQHFVDIPALLNHFKMRILANVSLVRPLQKCVIEKMVALYTFEGQEPTDLPFERNEVLEIIGKPQDEWWEARNALGNSGFVPANFLGHIDDIVIQRSNSETSSLSSENRLSGLSSVSDNNDALNGGSHAETATAALRSVSRIRNQALVFGGNCLATEHPTHLKTLRVPSWAKVKLDRRPNAYDTEALRLRKGEIIKVTKLHPSGLCEGILNGKKGTFPFTYVEFISDEVASTPTPI